MALGRERVWRIQPVQKAPIERENRQMQQASSKMGSFRSRA
jgi:hypothetical protein